MNCSGCDSDGMAASLLEPGSSASWARPTGFNLHWKCLVCRVDRVFGQYDVCARVGGSQIELLIDGGGLVHVDEKKPRRRDDSNARAVGCSRL
jgi:hypothetical protein